MQKFRLISDIHLEFGDFEFTDSNPDTILILAGDIGIVSSSHQRLITEEFLISCSKKFKQVIMIAGNHEYYNHSIAYVSSIFNHLIEGNNLSNTTFLDNQVIEIGNIVIYGGTMWTSFDWRESDVYAGALAERYMSDYTVISKSKIKGFNPTLPELDTESKWVMRSNPIKVADTISIHNKHLKKMLSTIKKAKKEGKKTLCINHHAPSKQSISSEFIGNTLNPAFVNNYDDIIEKNGPDILCHGHVHNVHDYMIGNTRILCNPRGYYGRENVEGFSIAKEFEL